MTIKREKITWPGARIKKKGEGLPQHEQNNVFGDLYVTIDVDFPKGEMSNDQRESNSRFFFVDFVLKFLFQIFSDKKFVQSTIENSTLQWNLEFSFQESRRAFSM